MIVKLEKETIQEEKLGNKGKFLLQMKKQGFNVPGGFILDSDVYDEVIESNGIGEKINSALSELTAENAREISDRITGWFDGVLIPEKILEEINMLAGDDVLYAVRSSGSKEDLAEYNSLLDLSGTGLMGYIQIKSINVYIPIYHGTEESTLDRGVGHLLGSSLPVGGTGTHCVLTGHSGLAGQKMFSDVNLMKAGDVFFLRVLGQTLAYKVVEIYTVLPEDTGKLTIDAGRDLCTLVTCTPYGVNSHRLLLRGERTECEEAVSVIEDAEFTPVEESTWGDEYRKGLIYGGLTVAGISVCYGGYRAVLHARRPKRRRYAMWRERMRGKHEAP